MYNGLFVYSIGFFEMVNKTFANAQNKYGLIGNTWKVFSILLQYCCQTNYEMTVSKMQTDFSEKFERQETQFST